MTAMKLDTNVQANILSHLNNLVQQDKPTLESTVMKMKGVGGHNVTANDCDRDTLCCARC